MKTYLTLFMILWGSLIAEDSASKSCKDGKDEFCGQCNVNGNCFTCYNSKLNTKTGICEAISTPVAKCYVYENDSTNCSVCGNNSWLKGGACVPNTLTNCYHQDDEKTCHICNGYLLMTNKTCHTETKCSNQCQSCVMSNGNKKCMYCALGFHLEEASDGSTACYQNSLQMKNCDQIINGKCHSCQFGFYVASATGNELICRESNKYSTGLLLQTLICKLIFLAFVVRN